jgi:hypothetical protein
MKLATILPLKYMYLEEDNDYHMALAHLCSDLNYVSFFRRHSARGDWIIMDNGIVEGEQQPLRVLQAAARCIGASEIVLPDAICDLVPTLQMGHDAADYFIQKMPELRLMAVPQGAHQGDWEQCLREMLLWPVHTIGFSKFIVDRLGVTRLDLLMRHYDEIHDAGKAVHLLGSPMGPYEVDQIKTWAPGRARGMDSGYPTFCTAGGMGIDWRGARPPSGIEHGFDFINADPDETLMLQNYKTWREWCGV